MMHHIVIVQRKFIPNLGQSFDAKRQCSHTQITKFRSKLDRINEFHIDYSQCVRVFFSASPAMAYFHNLMN